MNCDCYLPLFSIHFFSASKSKRVRKRKYCEFYIWKCVSFISIFGEINARNFKRFNISKYAKWFEFKWTLSPLGSLLHSVYIFFLVSLQVHACKYLYCPACSMHIAHIAHCKTIHIDNYNWRLIRPNKFACLFIFENAAVWAIQLSHIVDGRSKKWIESVSLSKEVHVELEMYDGEGKKWVSYKRERESETETERGGGESYEYLFDWSPLI